MKNLSILYDLTYANLKMFFRDKSALFWSLFFPFIIIGIFGMFDFASLGNSNVGLVYSENTAAYAEPVRAAFESNDSYKFFTGTKSEELRALENDDRVVVLEFTSNNERSKVDVNVYMGKENEQTGEIITLVTEKILADVSLQMMHIELPFEVNKEVVNTNNLRFIDFMVPGVIALALMQGALFGVIGAIVGNREKGVLRRIFATPLPKSVFLVSNITARTIISLFQIAILLIFAYLVFKIHIVGSFVLVIALSVLGSLTFLTMAILMSGFAKTSESARAMVMPVQMVFMFTGGVYFDRSVLPDWLYTISGFFPLTYLADTLRDVMIKGETLSSSSIQTGLVALIVWLVILVILSVRTFKWEIE